MWLGGTGTACCTWLNRAGSLDRRRLVIDVFERRTSAGRSPRTRAPGPNLRRGQRAGLGGRRRQIPDARARCGPSSVAGVTTVIRGVLDQQHRCHPGRPSTDPATDGDLVSRTAAPLAGNRRAVTGLAGQYAPAWCPVAGVSIQTEVKPLAPGNEPGCFTWNVDCGDSQTPRRRGASRRGKALVVEACAVRIRPIRSQTGLTEVSRSSLWSGTWAFHVKRRLRRVFERRGGGMHGSGGAALSSWRRTA